MVQQGDIIHNPVSGETFTFLQTSADTKGELLQMNVLVAPGGGQGAYPCHFHPRQEEKIVVKSGWIKVVVQSEERYYGPGETLIIPAGIPHQLWNARKSENLNYVSEFRPALQWETICETVLVLTQLGKINESGYVNKFQMSVILDKYPDNFAVPGPPVILQKAYIKCLSTLGRIAGYKSSMDYKSLVKNERIFEGTRAPGV